MKITFDNEQELISEILKSDINIMSFTLILLERLGIPLNKTAQNRLERLQEKRRAENEWFEGWKVKQSRIFSIEDVLYIDPLREVPSKKVAKAHLKTLVGEVKRGTIWTNDFRYHNGEYYFNEDGCRTVTYLLYFKGCYDEDTLHAIRNDLGIKEEDLKQANIF